MLTLEALFTAVLAWRLYRETMDGRVWMTMALLLAGGMVRVLDQGRAAVRSAELGLATGVRTLTRTGPMSASLL